MKMPFSLYAVLLLAISVTGCKQKPGKEKPTAIHGQSVDVSSLKRERYDLPERLYAEMADTSADLKQLEGLLKDLKKIKADSLKEFQSFDNENSRFYATLISKLAGIQDTSLRAATRKAVDTSLAHYHHLTHDWTSLNKEIAQKQALINDLYLILKITRTTAFMQQYQQLYFPSTTAAETVNKNMDSIINRLDSLIKGVSQ